MTDRSGIDPASDRGPVGELQGQLLALVIDALRAMPRPVRGVLVTLLVVIAVWTKLLGLPLPGDAQSAPAAPPGHSVTCVYVSPTRQSAPP